MSKLSGKLEQVAHRTGHRDGPELLEYLLDLVGLSAAALTKSIAESAIGRFIATSAVQQYRDLIEGMPVPDMVPSTVQALKRAAILDVGPATAQALTNSAAPSIKSVGTLIGKNAALQAAMRDEVSRTRAKPMARSSAAETVAEDANGETDQ
ncbi:hypothetical protein [Arthrobacter castelli]|uniref:hypothetical protein n=1 Tax=Arthrobacter castelli TaxID=271431 RepID=UPI00047B992C|nr:hypothetical protein [Arthrobacter castelli]